MLGLCERLHVLESSPAIADQPNPRAQRGSDPFTMLVAFARAAEFRMSNRDQIVNEIERPYIRSVQPGAEPPIIEARMTNI
jgi:hypothetical protein